MGSTSSLSTSQSIHPITELLLQWEQGNIGARDTLFRLLYDDLRALAHRQRWNHQAHHTLNTTAVVHELYLKLADQSGVGAQERCHFAALATKAMRNVVVDYARRMSRQKRGGDAQRVSFGDVEGPLTVVESEAAELLALHEALNELAALDADMAEVVEMHFFTGLSYEEIATLRGVSAKTVYRTIQKAKALLRRSLGR